MNGASRQRSHELFPSLQSPIFMISLTQLYSPNPVNSHFNVCVCVWNCFYLYYLTKLCFLLLIFFSCNFTKCLNNVRYHWFLFFSGILSNCVFSTRKSLENMKKLNKRKYCAIVEFMIMNGTALCNYGNYQVNFMPVAVAFKKNWYSISLCFKVSENSAMIILF